jgi:hypothetical protein
MQQQQQRQKVSCYDIAEAFVFVITFPRALRYWKPQSNCCTVAYFFSSIKKLNVGKKFYSGNCTTSPHAFFFFIFRCEWGSCDLSFIASKWLCHCLYISTKCLDRSQPGRKEWRKLWNRKTQLMWSHINENMTRDSALCAVEKNWRSRSPSRNCSFACFLEVSRELEFKNVWKCWTWRSNSARSERMEFFLIREDRIFIELRRWNFPRPDRM